MTRDAARRLGSEGRAGAGCEVTLLLWLLLSFDGSKEVTFELGVVGRRTCSKNYKAHSPLTLLPAPSTPHHYLWYRS